MADPSLTERLAARLAEPVDPASRARARLHLLDWLGCVAGARSAPVAEVARRAPGATILVQVNTTGEPGKGGCPLDDVAALLDAASAAGLTVDGLMTVGPTVGGAEAARPGFRATRRLVDRLGLATCSMGMSDDLEVAIEEGATRVRLGTALFGPRP